MYFDEPCIPRESLLTNNKYNSTLHSFLNVPTLPSTLPEGPLVINILQIHCPMSGFSTHKRERRTTGTGLTWTEPGGDSNVQGHWSLYPNGNRRGTLSVKE